MDRTAFEAWATDRGQAIDRDGGGGDGYYWPSVHNAWVGWQAAWTASRALALEEAAKLADRMAEETPLVEDVAAAIRAISRGADKE